MNTYTIGEGVRLQMDFKDATGVFIDPDVVKLLLKSPLGDETATTYPSAPITRISAGKYAANIQPNVASTNNRHWTYRWEGIGTLDTALEDQFRVEPSAFLTDPTEGIGIVAGIIPPSWLPAVRAATTAALPAHTRTGNLLTASANGALAAQDGVTLVTGDYLLVKNEGAGTHLENGVYLVTAIGSGSTPWKLQRAPWFDSDSEVKKGAVVQVTDGSVNGETFFALRTANPIVVNTTALQFTFGWSYA